MQRTCTVSIVPVAYQKSILTFKIPEYDNSSIDTMPWVLVLEVGHLSVWQLNLNFTINHCNLEARQSMNSKRRVYYVPFIHASNVSNARHISRTRPRLSTNTLMRTVHAWGTSQTRQRYASTLGYVPVYDTVYATRTPKHAHNTFNISLTRQDKVYTSKISYESQRVGTVIFFSKLPAHVWLIRQCVTAPLSLTYSTYTSVFTEFLIRQHTLMPTLLCNSHGTILVTPY